MIFLSVCQTIINNDDSNILRDYINVNVGKRIRMDCELNDSIISGHKKGLWLRLEDAEVFFYSTSRINSDQRFQIEQRTSLHMINNTFSYEIITYSLIIDNINLSDSGTYSCQSDNKIIKLFLLNIVERPYFITQETSTSLRTYIGNNISINCQAEGKPKPILSWIKKIDENNQITMINCSILSSSCQLDLLNVSRWHNGIYECVAMNIVGTIGRFYELDVQFPPDVYIEKENLHNFIGDTVILECLINSNPEPNIRWIHKFSNDFNQEIDLSKQYSHENLNNNENKIWYIENEQLNTTMWKTILFIKHIPKRLFNSRFICRAENSNGLDEKSIIIIEKSHISKKHRHTTSFMYFSTVSYYLNEQQISSTTTTDFLFEQINNTYNRSEKMSSYFKILFICIVFKFLIK